MNARRRGPGGATHGQTNTRLYRIWKGMISRCCCPSAKSFPWYGARGIAVCQEWIDAFEVFRDWANASGYEESLSLDRIDTNRNYQPDNCRWATRGQQMANMRSHRNSASRFKGVYLNRDTNRWYSQICVNGKKSALGSFGNEEDAARAYDAAAIAAHGEFSAVNFPSEALS